LPGGNAQKSNFTILGFENLLYNYLQNGLNHCCGFDICLLTFYVSKICIKVRENKNPPSNDNINTLICVEEGE
jgi:hypothetical protein